VDIDNPAALSRCGKDGDDRSLPWVGHKDDLLLAVVISVNDVGVLSRLADASTSEGLFKEFVKSDPVF
jgi:hypothetical protein